MEIARLSVPLVFSRLGEMIALLFYFSFIGNFFVSSLSQASLAWALLSFLAVVGIGFFRRRHELISIWLKNRPTADFLKILGKKMADIYKREGFLPLIEGSGRNSLDTEAFLGGFA